MCSAIIFDFSHWKVITSLLIYVLQLSHSECSLLPYNHYWLTSKRIVTPKGVISGAGIFILKLDFSFQVLQVEIDVYFDFPFHLCHCL